MFKKFLEKKGISEEAFEKMDAKEVAKLQSEFADEQAKELKTEFKSMIDDAKKGLISEDELGNKLEEFKKAIEGNDSEELKTLKDTVEKNQKILEEYKEKVKTQGQELKKMKDGGGLINPDFTVNKGVLRTMVEKHLKESGVLGDTEKNEHGIEVTPVNLPSNTDPQKAIVKQVIDFRMLSKKYVAQKAGENVFVGGSGTQAVFNQAINRTSIGEIAPPLTADEHVLDIFNVTNVTGSLMTLLVYENLEDNSGLVAEGAAPSADSRIELNSKDFKVFDFSVTATISKNLLRDSGEVIDELVVQLASGIKKVIDTNLLTSGGDNSAAPWGVFNTTHSCETFNPLLFTGTSAKANIISVIGKAKLQARLNNWMADSTFLNPNQWDEIEDLKDTQENSVRDNRLATNNVGETVAVKGMMKYQSTKMPANTMLIYNSNLQTIGLRQDIEAGFGYNDDDFKKRKVSWLMDIRAAYGQKAKESAIYVDNIADAIAILKENAAASLARIQAYATGDDASALTVATLINAGVTDVIEANLAEYAATIAGEASIADLPALQTLIDTDNAD